MTLYKLLGAGRVPLHGGTGTWPEPGTWLTVEPPIIPCKRGLHLLRVQDLPRWVELGTLWEVEDGGAGMVHNNSKVVTGRARLVRAVGDLTRDVLVTWAADCAEHVLPLFERRYPGDERPRAAIRAVRSGGPGTAIDAYIAATAAAANAAAAADAAAANAAAADAYARAAAANAAAANGAAECAWQGERLLVLLHAAARGEER